MTVIDVVRPWNCARQDMWGVLHVTSGILMGSCGLTLSAAITSGLLVCVCVCFLVMMHAWHVCRLLNVQLHLCMC